METRTVLLLASSHNCIFIISSFPHYAGVLSIWRTLKPFYNDAIYCSPFCSPCLGTIGRSYQEREWKTAQSNGEFPEDDTSSGNESQLIRPNSPLKRLQFIIPPAHPINTGYIQGTSQDAENLHVNHNSNKGPGKPYFLEHDPSQPILLQRYNQHL